MIQPKKYHPNYIKAQLLTAGIKLATLEDQYKNGSPAMKNYLNPKLLQAHKLVKKWENAESL
ncbi:MAG TPA: hypothetical protein VFF49_04520 [Thermodesulfobacteriota bacterium]|nr:hypothetical protein [Thermodesulfobacteriota bacterium]